MEHFDDIFLKINHNDFVPKVEDVENVATYFKVDYTTAFQILHSIRYAYSYGRDEGYDDGYAEGEGEGYTNGYIDGQQDN